MSHIICAHFKFLVTISFGTLDDTQDNEDNNNIMGENLVTNMTFLLADQKEISEEKELKSLS